MQPSPNDREFDLALLNAIDRIGNVALHQHVFILFKFKDGLARTHLREKDLRVERLVHASLFLVQLWSLPNIGEESKRTWSKQTTR
jgi:hypothetical protein